MYDNVILRVTARGHIGTEAPSLSMAFGNTEDREGLGKSKKNKEKIRD